MDARELALFTSLFHFPAGIVVTSIHPSASELVIAVACQASRMPCPECQQPSERIHSRYQRTVADLPCAGRTVVLVLTVRKFVCSTPTCSQRIFTERLPGLVASYGRMTGRLIALVQALGLAAGGQMGTRLAERIAVATTASTLLRHLMQLPPPAMRPVRVLGIDDFAWKKRHRYGTLLVDLERRQIIEVLADRESATVEQWLRAHPEIEIISRDRGKEYAKAATLAAPQAQQVVDRFHLVRNLAEVLHKVLASCRAEIRQQDPNQPQLQPQASHSPCDLPTPQTWQQRTPPHVERTHQARQAERDDRFTQMTALRAQGLTQQAIAQRMGMSERAVRRWLKQAAAPTGKRRFRRRSIFDPYAEYVLQRWQEGMHEGKQLYEEIRAQGFPGSVRVVQRFVQTLPQHPEAITLPPASVAERFSANNLAWVFIRAPKQLTAEEQVELKAVCDASPTVALAYQLTQQFLGMLRQRTGELLESWVQAVEASPLVELRRFAQGLLKDKSAVVAGLTLSYSNGPVEAQVHKLKLIKRSMFGRAKLPLLRQRLLHAA